MVGRRVKCQCFQFESQGVSIEDLLLVVRGCHWCDRVMHHLPEFSV